MEQPENNKTYIYSYIFSFIVILVIILTFYLYNKSVNNDKDIKTNSNIGKETINPINEVNSIKEEEIIDKKLNSGEYTDVINTITEKENTDKEEKMKLVYGYLSYGNYFYKEEENSKKAMDILNTMDDDQEVLYYKGYSQEIIKNYTGALDYYNKGLEIKNLKNEDKSSFLNQIGHLYDLKGEFDKVLVYYADAYKLDKNNVMAISNLGRYYLRMEDYNKAYEFQKQALLLASNSPLKSELSFSLSSIELELNGLKPDIDKSIEYARQSIDYYPDYPMGYVALARGLYMKNDSKYYKEIEESLDKSIELNPNGYSAYNLYAMHEFDKGNFDKTKELFEKAAIATDSDMILMDSQRSNNKNVMYFKMHIFSQFKEYKLNKEDIFLFFDKIKPVKAGISILKEQIRRDGYGALNFISNNKEFDSFLKEFQ